MAPNVLAKIAFDVRNRISERKKNRPEDLLVKKMSGAALHKTNSLRGALQAPQMTTMNLVCEIKYASPSEGQFLLAQKLSPIEVATQYLQEGAAALSILTERDHFKGDYHYLTQVRGAFPKAPLLMKDFILEDYQIYEARLLGADAILLIMALLGPERAKELRKVALSVGLETLVEVHNERELQEALSIGADLIGINNRDLSTLKVSLDVSKELIKIAPSHTVMVSESGLRSNKELRELKALGFSAFLVGSSLMKDGEPGSALKKLLMKESL